MTRLLFHGFACAILLFAVWNDYSRPLHSQATEPDPQTLLVEAMTQAGFAYAKKESFFGEEHFTFTSASCHATIDVLYLPNSYPEATATRAFLRTTTGHQVIIHDGEIITGLGPRDLMPHLIWGKLLVGFRLSKPRPWISIVLVVVIPPGCEGPSVDWKQLSLS